MLSRLTLVTSLTLLSTVSLFTQDVEAQRFRFRSSYRSCPQQVRYVPPPCATLRYAVPGQSQMAFQAPVSMTSSTGIAPGPVGNAVQPGALSEAQPGVSSESSTQTSNLVAPVPVSEPGLIPPANLQPVPTGDTEIVPEAQVPPALEPPKIETPKPAEIVVPEPAVIEVPKTQPITQPTPPGAKSILDNGK